MSTPYLYFDRGSVKYEVNGQTTIIELDEKLRNKISRVDMQAIDGNIKIILKYRPWHKRVQLWIDKQLRRIYG